MSQHFKRTLTLLFCAVMLLGILAATAPAAEAVNPEKLIDKNPAVTVPIAEPKNPVSAQVKPDRHFAIGGGESNDYYTSYTFETFDDLEELAGRTFGETVCFKYVGSGDLVISRDVEFPKNAFLEMRSSKLVINEGVTLTIRDSSYGSAIGKLEINGTFDSYAYIYEVSELTVNGTFNLYSTLSLDTGATYSGLENVNYMADYAEIRYDCYPDSTAELVELLKVAAADNSGIEYEIYFQGADGTAISQSVTVPENCRLSLQNGNSFTIPAGVTVTVEGTMDIYAWDTGHTTLTVAGNLVNNSTFEILIENNIAPVLKFTGTGKYSGKGVLSIWSFGTNPYEWNEIITGLDASNLEITGGNLSNGSNWYDIQDASDLIQLSKPTNLTWHKALEWVDDGEDGYYETVSRKGAITWKGGSIQEEDVTYHYYFIQIYKDGEPFYWFRWGFSDYYEENNLPCGIDASMYVEDVDWESGTYYFTVQAIPQPNGSTTGYRASEIATSTEWTYTKPSKTLSTPTNLTWNWPTMSWTGPSGHEYYQLDICHTPTVNGDIGIIDSFRFEMGDSYTFDQYDLEYISQNYGSGYYCFYVRAMSTDITKAYHSVWSDESKMQYFANLTLETANVASTGKIKVSWTADANAEKYEVYRSTSKNGTYTKLITTANTSVTHTGAEAGKAYYYKVRAVDADGNKSNFSNIEGRYCDLARPTLTSVNVASTGKIKLSWNAIDGATGYEVYRSTSKNGTYTKLITTTKTSVTHTGAVAGTAYYYKVRALHEVSGSNSAYSTVVGRYCDLAQPTLSTANVASTGKIKLSWNAVSGASKYEVYRSTDNETWTKMITTTKTSVTHTGAVAGTAYYYKVRAIHSNSSANSAYSAVKSRYCDLPRPTLTVELNSAGKPFMSWNAISGASKYQVYRSNDGETWTLMITTTKTSVTHTGAVAGNTYYYRVRAVHSNTSANSAYSVAQSIAVN